MSSAPIRFIKQDLRRQTFRRRDLQNAHFENCDLRGCDFSQAMLRDAQFVRCRVGVSHRWVIALIPLLPITILLFHAVSSLIFASLGTLPEQAAWAYVKILTQVLAIATFAAGIHTLPWPLASVARLVLGTTVAALMGFFYVGSGTNNNPTLAMGGAIALGCFGAVLAWRWRSALMNAIWGALGAIAAYGLTFWLWTDGSSLLTTGHWLRGLGTALVALISLGITLRNLAYCGRSLQRSAQTSFRRADLTNCRFVATDMTHCNLTDITR
ncbi:MAG: pentapeptide repeat-containing protein [Cyanobacteria bacterium P01_H01_bin.153]